jgi:hypothetical protein
MLPLPLVLGKVRICNVHIPVPLFKQLPHLQLRSARQEGRMNENSLGIGANNIYFIQ